MEGALRRELTKLRLNAESEADINAKSGGRGGVNENIYMQRGLARLGYIQ